VLNRRLRTLLGASVLTWMVGNGLFPLLPLYAVELGATVEGTGMLLAAGFAALAAGSLAAPRLARAVGSYKRT
jgi:MFS family permease